MNIINELINAGLPVIGDLKFLSRTPVHAYSGNMVTDEIIGYKYNCIAPKFGYSNIAVKILGEPCLENVEAPADVKFSNLEAVIYTNRRTGRPDISFKASDVVLAK